MLQDFLTVAIEIIAVGFALVMAIDFVQGIAQWIQESKQPSAPALQKESVQPQIAVESLEDPWLTTLTAERDRKNGNRDRAPSSPSATIASGDCRTSTRDGHKTEQSKA